MMFDKPRHRRIRPRTLIISLVAVVAVAAGITVIAVSSSGSGSSDSVMFVDSVAGDDTNSGTTAQEPLQSLSLAAERATAGILLKRNSVFSGTVTITADGSASSPLQVTAYGTGDLPKIVSGSGEDCIVLAGDHIVLDSVEVDGCTDGVRIAGTDNTVQNSVISGNGAGVTVNDGADRCRVLQNTLTDNNLMIVNTPGGVDDYGAFGIAINAADGCEIAYNTISGSHAASYDWDQDGGAVEIFGSSNTQVHHNMAIDNLVFSELGNVGTDGNTYYYNVVSSTLDDAAFLTVHGGTGTYGGVTGTVAINNTVVLTGTDATAFYCDSCSTGVLNTVNNLVVAPRLAGFTESWGNHHNLFTTSPGFVDASSGDYHLTSTSKALAAGTPTEYTTDFDGKPVGTTPSIGAYES